jgi:RNA polymerase sigma-70 factor (ECF subfamily)
MDDRIAVSRIKEGYLDALEFLVNRYQAQAMHAAYLISYDRALAEDIVQTAFVKVVERIQQFDDQRPFAPWFFRIVVNDAIKITKKQKQNISLDEQFDDAAAKLGAWLMEPTPGPSDLTEQKETRQLILQAIECLAPKQRAVIVMRYFLEMSEAELAAQMDRPLSTIKWWLREARRRLRELIGSSRGFEDGKLE